LIRQDDFCRLNVRNKEHVDTAWIRVPGYDARSLATFVEPQQSSPQPSEDVQPSRQHVSNAIYGTSYGIQAGTINGNISQGTAQR
jgi:hypothetical protein